MTIDPSTYSYAMKALESLAEDLKARISSSAAYQLTTKDATAIAKAVANAASGDVKKSASVLIAKGEALLKIQAEAGEAASSLLAGASTLKARVGTSLYSFLNTDPFQWGTRQGELLTALVDDTNALARAMTGASARLATQNNDVAVFVKEVNQLEKAAAGTGYLPVISSILSSSTSAIGGGLAKAVWPLAIVAGIGGLIYLTAPQLLKGRR